jgi:hypothetical protein
MDTRRILSHLSALLRAFLWLAVVGLLAIVGRAVMEQVTAH